jgi:hypothetical protein
MKKYEVSLNFYLKDLEGKEMPDFHAGKLLANNLSMATEGDALKYMAWALGFFKNESVSLDESDLNSLISYVKNHQRMIALAKGPLLSYLEDLKLSKDEKGESNKESSKKKVSTESI